MAAIHDVAHAAGVSISTVSYAFTGKRRISESTRTRVLTAAEELGYEAHAGARMLAGRRTNLLAVAAPLHEDTSASAHMAFVLATATASRRHDYDVVLLTEEDANGSLDRVSRTRLVDGVIILDVTEDDPRADFVREIDIPSVLVGIPADTEGLICVDLDFEAAARLTVDRLAPHGHTSFALLGDAPSIFARGSNFPRRFRSAFTQHVDALGYSSVFKESSPHVPELRSILDDLLSREPAPTALVMQCNERTQDNVLQILASRGIEVPADLSIVSAASTFDTSRLRPPLDVIPLIPAASTDRAVDLLMRSMHEEISPQVELVPPTYIEHGSVDRPRTLT